MADGIFVDFIPEGQEAGALTGNGFKDFVPAPEPQPKEVEEKPEPVKEVEDKKVSKK